MRGQTSTHLRTRLPRLERVDRRITVLLGGVSIVDTTGAFRVLETSHPPAYHLPPADFAPGCRVASRRGGSFCEWKGWADYFTLVAGGRREVDAAWAYPDRTPAFRPIAGYPAPYAGRMDACFVDGCPRLLGLVRPARQTGRRHR